MRVTLMSNDYWSNKELSNKISLLERRLAIASGIKDKRKKLKEVIFLREQIKALLKEYESSKIDDNFFLKNILNKIKSLIFRVEKEHGKK